MYLGGHVGRGAHLLAHIPIKRCCEAKVAKLERPIVCDQDILQFYVHMRKATLMVQRRQTRN